MSEEYAAVERIVGSRHFAKSPLLSSFLTYASRRALEDGMVRISEHEIGLNVFQRSASFDPREDNIVRTYARHLRKRLQEYYETDGENDLIRVEIPKGTYVPVFRTIEAPAEFEVAVADSLPEKGASQANFPVARSRWRQAWMLWAAALLLAVYSTTLFWAGRWTVHPQTATEHRNTLHPLWTQLFRPDRDTFVIPGDVGFVIFQQENHRTFSLEEYLNWFSSPASNSLLSMSYLRDRTYTSMQNLAIVSSLQRLPETLPDRFIVRAAKDVRFDDLRDGNAILLGSNFSNPWDEIFGEKLNFHFVDRPNEDRDWIVNRHPVEGEASIYEPTTTNTTHRTNAVVAFVQNLDKNGHVLLLQGLDAAGTQAAADMLLNSEEMQRVIQAAMNRYGAAVSFELLIEANSLDANSHATSSRIVASRFHE
ncbi:hypothetical protein [Tunturiibacter gelidiferens]|uniref:hypothetical protein n=1 Tax=Tunturiibacter gelidiferens TaxID=3069689 RepID=UPI003D9BBD8A